MPKDFRGIVKLDKSRWDDPEWNCFVRDDMSQQFIPYARHFSQFLDAMDSNNPDVNKKEFKEDGYTFSLEKVTSREAVLYVIEDENFPFKINLVV